MNKNYVYSHFHSLTLFFFNTLWWNCEYSYSWSLLWPGNFKGTQSPPFPLRSSEVPGSQVQLCLVTLCCLHMAVTISLTWLMGQISQQDFVQCLPPASRATKPGILLLSFSPNDLGVFCSLVIRGDIGITGKNQLIWDDCPLSWKVGDNSFKHLLLHTYPRGGKWI